MSGCSDCYFGGKTINPRGREDSPFVIVGESPGIMEIHYGKPFVGPSGKVLEETLEMMGIGEHIEPYYTNAVMCLPRKKTPESLASACVACRSRLVEDISRHPRKVILALGNGAIWATLGDFSLKITKERGKLFKSPLASVGVVATVHPAFLLRGGGNFKQFQQDIQYALSLLEEGDTARKLPNGVRWKVLESLDDAQEFISTLNALPKDTPIACDIETTGFNHQRDHIIDIGFQFDPQNIIILPQHLFLHSHIDRKDYFPKHLKWIWHNGKFDCRFLRHLDIPAKVDEDTMLMSYALNERRGIHDLDQVASDHLGSPKHKTMLDPYLQGKIIDPHTSVKRNKNYGDVPKEILWKYLALDIADTFQLYHHLRPQVSDDVNLEKFYTQHLIPGSAYLLKLELNGFMVDDEFVLQNHAKLTEELKSLKEDLNVIAREVMGADINPNSWQQLKVLLYDTLKLAPNSWATDDDTLEKLLERHPGHPAILALRKYRKAAKSHGTYVKPLLKDRSIIEGKSVKECVIYPDNRVHPSYLLHGTATSRLSCKDPNVQNIPREPHLRGQFIPKPGYIILEVDYSQAELRSLACLSRCPDLMEIFLTGKDLHNELSIFLFGENYTREDKMKAKSVNFGIVYGRTAPSIAEAFDVSIQEAQSWIDGWFTRFPVAAEFIQKCRMAPLRNETITTCFGNKKRPGIVSREKLNDLQNESANFPHQSIASNLTVKSGIELFDLLRDDWDTHIINTVHDCIVSETLAEWEHIKKVAKIIQDTMERIPLEYKGLDAVPFKAEAEIGWRWGNLLKLSEVEKMYNGDISKIPDYIAPH